MKLVKILGPVVVAAVITAAVGAASASAADNVVLCKKLVSSKELCPAGELLPKGTKILAVNEGANPIFKSMLNAQCESSHIEGVTDFETGATLLGKITSYSFTKNCKPCTTVTMEGLPYVFHLLHKEDKWVLDILSLRLRFSGCTGGFECTFSASTVSIDIQDNSGQLLLDTLEAPLALISGSKILCGETMKFIATYKAECKNASGTVIPCWPALDKEELEK